jgi:two-component system phosphate regulon sensor histidine kinase PhoR
LSSNDINFDDFADMLAVSGSNNETMRITIIDHEWNVVGDSQVNTNELFNVEKHSPSNRPEIKGALESNYGTDTRTSDTTGEDLIYVAIMRNKNDINSGLIRVALPFNVFTSVFNFFIYPFFIIFILVLASSTFLSLNVENNLRTQLSKLLKNTQRALKGESLKLTKSEDTQMESLSNAVEEISERLNLEINQAIDQRVQFGNVLDSINQGVIIFGKNMKVRFANDIAFELFGKHQFFLNEKISSKKLLPINKMLKNVKKNNSAELDFSIKVNGLKKFLLLSATQMNTTDEFILVINDITSIKELEERRKNLVTDISHEIKTPISVIKAGSETLQDGAINDPKIASKFLDSMISNSERMSEMLDDLLELEKIEFGQLTLKNEKINVYDQLNLVVNSLNSISTQKKLIIKNDINKKVKIYCDKQVFIGIFVNLLENAIKYSKFEGEINLTNEINSNTMIICVQDNGYGIEKSSIKRIFDRFFRTGRARAHTKGTGLGLSLVKQLIKTVGGDIKVESKINQGSSFFVSIPLKS